MKWYIYKTDGDNVGLLLDHNTTSIVAWVSKADYIAAGGTEAEYGSYGNNNKGPITVMKQLTTDTTGWKASGIDLIDANDIAKITENTTWDKATAGSHFYFDTNTGGASEICTDGNTSGCKYGWLYDRTSTSCSTYGCLNNSNIWTTGYWTKDASAAGSDYAWIINGDGYMSSFYVFNNSYGYGVRPVITISKSNIK